jgi:hypothetical protein
MPSRAKGVTVAEMAEALGWQVHTVRGALKKKLGLVIVSETNEKRGWVYCQTACNIAP